MLCARSVSNKGIQARLGSILCLSSRNYILWKKSRYEGETRNLGKERKLSLLSEGKMCAKTLGLVPRKTKIVTW